MPKGSEGVNLYFVMFTPAHQKSEKCMAVVKWFVAMICCNSDPLRNYYLTWLRNTFCKIMALADNHYSIAIYLGCQANCLLSMVTKGKRCEKNVICIYGQGNINWSEE